MLYNKVQANRDPWNMCVLAGMLSAAVKSQRARLRDGEAVSQRGIDQKFLTTQELDCSVHFIFHFIYLSLGFGTS